MSNNCNQNFFLPNLQVSKQIPGLQVVEAFDPQPPGSSPETGVLGFNLAIFLCSASLLNSHRRMPLNPLLLLPQHLHARFKNYSQYIFILSSPSSSFFEFWSFNLQGLWSGWIYENFVICGEGWKLEDH